MIFVFEGSFQSETRWAQRRRRRRGRGWRRWRGRGRSASVRQRHLGDGELRGVGDQAVLVLVELLHDGRSTGEETGQSAVGRLCLVFKPGVNLIVRS